MDDKKTPKGRVKSGLGAFFMSNCKDALKTVVDDVVVPYAKKAFIDAASNGAKALMGEKPDKKPPTVNSQIQYKDYSSQSAPVKSVYYAAPQRTKQIYFTTLGEAQDVLSRMQNDCREKGWCSLGDYYTYSGADVQIKPDDHGYGWRDLEYAQISRGYSGYAIELPKMQTK